MAKLPTMKVTDGKVSPTINVSDLADWQARGFKPIEEPKEPTKKTGNEKKAGAETEIF